MSVCRNCSAEIDWIRKPDGGCIGDYLFLDVAAYYEEQYNLTVTVSDPIRKSWFNIDLPREVVENFENKRKNAIF